MFGLIKNKNIGLISYLILHSQFVCGLNTDCIQGKKIKNKFFCSPLVMESQYQPFSATDSSLDEADRNISQRTGKTSMSSEFLSQLLQTSRNQSVKFVRVFSGMKRILTYILYSGPLLLLLILLLVLGVICRTLSTS